MDRLRGAHSAGSVSHSPAVTAGDRASPPLTFEEVWEGYADFVFAVLLRLGVPRASVDDAVQEVFVVVHRRLSTVHGPDVLRSWLYGVCVRVTKSHLRKERFWSWAKPLEGILVPAKQWTDAHTERREAFDVLLSLLEGMPAERRHVFVLVELEERSVPEVAELLGCNVNTAYSRLRLARADFERAVKRRQAAEGSIA